MFFDYLVSWDSYKWGLIGIASAFLFLVAIFLVLLEISRKKNSFFRKLIEIGIRIYEKFSEKNKGNEEEKLKEEKPNEKKTNEENLDKESNEKKLKEELKEEPNEEKSNEESNKEKLVKRRRYPNM